jgi:hypothetical protein
MTRLEQFLALQKEAVAQLVKTSRGQRRQPMPRFLLRWCRIVGRLCRAMLFPAVGADGPIMQEPGEAQAESQADTD